MEMMCDCVKGPNTVSRANISRQPDGKRKVTYVPVEVGVFTITIKWNDWEVPGNRRRSVFPSPSKTFSPFISN